MAAGSSSGSGPLAGVKVLELGGIGPGPFAGMMLADLGADVVRVDRPDAAQQLSLSWHGVLLRGRRSLALDLKAPEAAGVVLDLAESCDALIEGFRPGVVERLGVGPEAVRSRNPRLVYGRMTGWGQAGPLSRVVGHDINYLAVAGALHPLAGPAGLPSPPLNMLGDFGGGGMLLAVGVLAGILEARQTGVGRVVDVAIVDGTALLTGMLQAMLATGAWSAERGGNLFDGGAPFYRTYATADDQWLAVGALEPPFYAAFVAGLGLAEELAGVEQHDQSAWPRMREIVARRLRERPLREWLAVFDGTDACVTPVIAPGEVLTAHNGRAARSYAQRGGSIEPLPAPRFAGTEPSLPAPAPAPGQHTREILVEIGVAAEVIDEWVARGVVADEGRGGSRSQVG